MLPCLAVSRIGPFDRLRANGAVFFILSLYELFSQLKLKRMEPNALNGLPGKAPANVGLVK